MQLSKTSLFLSNENLDLGWGEVNVLLIHVIQLHTYSWFSFPTQCQVDKSWIWEGDFICTHSVLGFLINIVKKEVR